MTGVSLQTGFVYLFLYTICLNISYFGYLARALKDLTVIQTSFETGSLIKREFDKFLSNVVRNRLWDIVALVYPFLFHNQMIMIDQLDMIARLHDFLVGSSALLHPGIFIQLFIIFGYIFTL